MIQIPFLYVPIAGVCCYTILLLALAAAKKNRLIRSFMNLLGCYLLWTAGSMLMRLQFYPGFELWYEVSIPVSYTHLSAPARPARWASSFR